MPIGYIVDDDAPDKVAAGGAAAFAAALPESAIDEQVHLSRCPSCAAIGEPFGCVGLVETPLSANAERWLVERLPVDIEGLRGYLLRKAIAEYGYNGDEGARLRSVGMLEAKGAFTRHFGPFFRRFTVSSEQILEELFCAGDVAPSHALAILVHLGAVEVDGAVPESMEQGPALGELMNDIASRKSRTKFAVEDEAGTDASVQALRRYLAALHGAFVVDATVKLFGVPGDEEEPSSEP